MAKARAASGGVPVAVIYTRVSTDDQATEGTSLAAQLAECRRYVAGRGWAIDTEFQDVMSGMKDARPSYQELLVRVRALRGSGRSVAVVVSALDRFGRRLLERVRCREELKVLGVSTHSVREGGEVNDMLAGFLAVMAEEESKRLGTRMRHTWAELNARGWWKTATQFVPWGYQTRPATEDERRRGAPLSVLEPHLTQASVVREAFERVAQGERINSVTRWVQTLPTDVRGGRSGSNRRLQTALRNPVYVGRFEPDGPCGQWLPIVPQETWDTVQERLDAHQRIPRQASGRYLLTGLLRCPDCDNRMQGQMLTTRNSRVGRYRCAGGAGRGEGSACTATADQQRVEALVVRQVQDVLNTLMASARMQDALERTWSHLSKPQPTTDEMTHKRLLRQVKQGQERIVTATRRFVDGEIGKPAYDGLVAQEQQAIASAESELARLEQTRVSSRGALPTWSEVQRLIGSCAAAFGRADVEQQRELLGMFVERIVAHRLSRGHYAVDIRWTALGQALQQVAA